MICISSHPQIRQRAYEIFQERVQTGRKGDALSDWLEAEYQSTGTASPLRGRCCICIPNLLLSLVMSKN
jgi:hypothetical protein